MIGIACVSYIRQHLFAGLLHASIKTNKNKMKLLELELDLGVGVGVGVGVSLNNLNGLSK